ncbi:MAG: hypothetical protein BZ136_04395, partial [Methanosphaera sp. rholeuAM74]
YNTPSRSTSTNTRSSNYGNYAPTTRSSAAVSAGTTVATTEAVGTVNEEKPDETPSEEDKKEETPSDADSGKSYEISQKNSSNDSTNILYFAGSVVLIGACAGYGFMRFRKK